MSATAAPQSQIIDPKRLLRPQTKLDIIVDIDFFTGQADVRSSMILDISGEQLVAAQSDPPILKSRIGQTVEATVVYNDHISNGSTRWGWSSKVLGIDNAYRLNKNDPDSAPAAVVYLSPPLKSVLSKTNIRQAYRLEITLQSGINIILPASEARISLLNFSAGGVMISSKTPPPFALGQEVPFKLHFPVTTVFLDTYIEGSAVVVRLEYEPGDQTVKSGLKFMNLTQESNRAMEKIINYYMLEEQRRRNRME